MQLTFDSGYFILRTHVEVIQTFTYENVGNVTKRENIRKITSRSVSVMETSASNSFNPNIRSR